MLKHEFGIMDCIPKSGKRYDKYEPQKYNCISINDNDLEKIVEKLIEIEVYHHTLDNKQKGLAYCGITLIPPCSLGLMLDAIINSSELKELYEMILKAQKDNKWIIHFGI